MFGHTSDPWPFPARWWGHFLFAALYLWGFHIHHNISTEMSGFDRAFDGSGLYFLADQIYAVVGMIPGLDGRGLSFYLGAQLQTSLVLWLYAFMYYRRTSEIERKSSEVVGDYLVYYEYEDCFDSPVEWSDCLPALIPISFINALGSAILVEVLKTVNAWKPVSDFMWWVIRAICGPNGTKWFTWFSGELTPGIFIGVSAYPLYLVYFLIAAGWHNYRIARFKRVETSRELYTDVLARIEQQKREYRAWEERRAYEEKEKRERERELQQRLARQAQKRAEEAETRRQALLKELASLDLSRLPVSPDDSYRWRLPAIFDPCNFIGIAELNVTQLPSSPPEQRYNDREQRWETIGKQKGPIRGLYLLSLEHQEHRCSKEVGESHMRGSSTGDKVLYICTTFGTVLYLHNPVRREAIEETIRWKHSEIEEELSRALSQVKGLLQATYVQLMRGGQRSNSNDAWS